MDWKQLLAADVPVVLLGGPSPTVRRVVDEGPLTLVGRVGCDEVSILKRKIGEPCCNA